MKHLKFILPCLAVALVVPACASDEAPIEDPGSNDAPISTIDEGVDTEVEKSGNLGFEGDEDG